MEELSKKSGGGGINRDSNIELLKIIAIFLIVISHVVQTLGTDYGLGIYNDYVIVLGRSTTDAVTLILSSLMYFGVLGNNIFFICTAWFLIDKKPRPKKKTLTLGLDTWTISIIMLVFVLFFRGGDISTKMLIKSLFPVIFCNNWYISCYIVFCFIHPFLNEIINNSSQKRLFRITILLTGVYIFLNYIRPVLFTNELVVWIAVYFMIAYLKKYTFCMESKTINLSFLIIGIMGNACAILLTNFVGLRVSALNNWMQHWLNNCSPFIIMIALGLFNLFRQCRFKNRA